MQTTNTTATRNLSITDLSRCEAEARAMRDAYLADATARLFKRAASAIQALFTTGAATRSA